MRDYVGGGKGKKRRWRGVRREDGGGLEEMMEGGGGLKEMMEGGLEEMMEGGLEEMMEGGG